MIRITTPLKKEEIVKLKAGEEVFLSGIIYTARDQAHKKSIPFDLEGVVIYYCAPTRTMPGQIIGACGPTTSRRMDNFTPSLLKAGLSGMIGKGNRSKEVVDAIKKQKAVYFLAYAGCGALINKYVKNKKLIAYPELGPEAIYALEVKDFPLIVAIDSQGRNIYKNGV